MIARVNRLGLPGCLRVWRSLWRRAWCGFSCFLGSRRLSSCWGRRSIYIIHLRELRDICRPRQLPRGRDLACRDSCFQIAGGRWPIAGLRTAWNARGTRIGLLDTVIELALIQCRIWISYVGLILLLLIQQCTDHSWVECLLIYRILADRRFNRGRRRRKIQLREFRNARRI